MKRLCVFCGSSPGAHPAYIKSARTLGHILAREGIGLVYGGASIGVMRAVADAVLERGGDVLGIIPRSLLEREVAHDRLTKLRVVGSMHERKALMSEMSDAFVALPGGMGTLEEYCEVMTWAQLGLHRKPCGLLNVNNYYDHLIEFFDHATAERFLRHEHRSMIIIDDDPEKMLERLKSYYPPRIEKLIGPDET